jgi:hypothetical protein
MKAHSLFGMTTSFELSLSSKMLGSTRSSLKDSTLPY